MLDVAIVGGLGLVVVMIVAGRFIPVPERSVSNVAAPTRSTTEPLAVISPASIAVLPFADLSPYDFLSEFRPLEQSARSRVSLLAPLSEGGRDNNPKGETVLECDQEKQTQADIADERSSNSLENMVNQGCERIATEHALGCPRMCVRGAHNQVWAASGSAICS